MELESFCKAFWGWLPLIFPFSLRQILYLYIIFTYIGRYIPDLLSPYSNFIVSHLILGRPLSSCPQSLPASESFPMSQLLAWGGQSTGASASASFLPKKSQGQSPSEWTGWISLQSKGLSRVFSNTTVQKHQFFSTPLSSQTNSHIHTWPLEKP